MAFVQQLLFVSACAIAAGFLLRVLLRTGWRRVHAAALILALALNPVTLYAATHGLGPVLLAGTLGLVIASIRRIERVGDVQSQMTFGILLSLLLFLTPAALVLIPILVFWGPALSPDGRKDWRAFLALLMIGCLPTSIIGFGLWEFSSALQDHADKIIAAVSGQFSRWPVFSMSWEHAGRAAVESGLWAIGPVLVMQAFWARRRYLASTSAALTICLVLYFAAHEFGWAIDRLLPASIAMAMTMAWIATAYVPQRAQATGALLLLGCAVLGWAIVPDQRDKESAAPHLRQSIDATSP